MCLFVPCGQVLLMPNFTVCVTREMRCVDGFDTIELLEQVGGARSACMPRGVCTLVLVSASVFRVIPPSSHHPFASKKLHQLRIKNSGFGCHMEGEFILIQSIIHPLNGIGYSQP